MTGYHHRLARPLAAALTVLLIALASALSASTASASSPPSCPAGTPPGNYPPPDCVNASSVSDSYTTPLQRTSLSVTHHLAGHGEYTYVLVSVKVSFSDARPECPEGGVPLGDIPCQQGSATIGLAGRYVAKAKNLDTANLPPYIGTPACTPQADQGTCTYNFRLNEDVMHGSFVYVMSVGVQQLTQNPANDVGEAGFEFSVGITVPKPPTTAKTKTK